ncbi:circadian clock protein KaiC [bacterium SCGC AG-212-C10]|nr:circadian clock protein KaiC [bacterium SCGC AG-212-C10]
MRPNGAGAGVTNCNTGVAGLDYVLGGGLPEGRVYLTEGEPGSGKTTLALQFLYEGAAQGEVGLYLGLSETVEELNDVVASHGWAPPPFQVLELHPSDDSLSPDSQYTIFHPSEVELGATTKRIIEAIETNKPRRVVLDSLSEMRLLAQSPFRFRRQIIALKHYLAQHGCTALFLDDRAPSTTESPVHTLTHGVISMEHYAADFGTERRRLRISKLRGQEFVGGYHDFNIVRGGIEVFPRLVPPARPAEVPAEPLASGIAQLDTLLGGGIEYGTSTLFVGPTGSGKSSVAAHFAMGAIATGHRAAVFTFDETVETFVIRCTGLGLKVKEAIEDGSLFVLQVDPATLSPGEFACRVTGEVDNGARVVVIDSLNGYLTAMVREHALVAQLHELLTHNNQMGAMTLLVMAQAGILGPAMTSPVDASYLADNVLLFRYFEAFGSVHKALSVLKRRRGGHETSIRRLTMDARGIGVGEPLLEFRGVLTGVPEYGGSAGTLEGQGR